MSDDDEFDDSPCPHTGKKEKETFKDGTAIIWCLDCGGKAS